MKFYDNFLAGLEARGEYLNLAQLYLTLKSLYGESDEDAGEGKSTFSYQFLLAIHKEERAYPFLLHVFDYRGAPPVPRHIITLVQSRAVHVIN